MTDRTKHTMRDVARLAGVSIATVSAVLNGNVNVRPERKRRVLEAMTALDYHPDEVARSLKKGRTNVIGIIVPDITNAFYPEVIRGVEDAARRAGYGVLLCDSRENAKEEEEHLSNLFARRVDGVLLACTAGSTAYDTSVRRRFPIVFVDRTPSAAAEPTVSTDNVQAGYAATTHLIELGHERIAMLTGDLGLSPHFDRLEGFRKAMQESQLPVRDGYLACRGMEIENSRHATRQLLESGLRPTAFLVSNSKLMLGLLEAVEDTGTVVPNQVSVIGFDDYVWNRYVSPSLTTVAQATYEMGRRSFNLLQQTIGRSQGHEITDKHIRLPVQLHVRGSTAALAEMRQTEK